MSPPELKELQIYILLVQLSDKVSTLRLVGCGHNPWLGHTKVCHNGTFVSLLGLRIQG